MSGGEGAEVGRLRRLYEDARGESEVEREAKYERFKALSEEKRKEREVEERPHPRSTEPYPPPIEFPDPDIIKNAAMLVRVCEYNLEAMRALRRFYADPREQELAELDEWVFLQHHLAASIGMSVRKGGSKGGRAKTGTSKASDSQRAKFLHELQRAKGPTYNARVQTAMRRSGWPLSLDSARRLGKLAGLK